MLIILAMPCILLGHGRNSTSIRANVDESGVVVDINAVVIDLLQMTGTAVDEWKGYSREGREQVLQKGGGLLVERFRLVADKRLMPSVEIDEIKLPESESGPGRWLPANQQSVTMRLRYPIPAAPGELVFWEMFAANPSREPLLTQILIRRKGELVLLPAELGTGFPLALSFDWESEPEPLAEQSDLGSAVSGWQNRPPNSILEFSINKVTWRVFVPYRSLLQGLSLPMATGLDELESRLSSNFSLLVDGQPPENRSFGLYTHTMSAHDIAHGGEEYHGDLLDAMLEIRISCTFACLPQEVEVGCSLIGDSLPVLYTSILPPNGPPQFFTLTSQSPALNWRPIP